MKNKKPCGPIFSEEQRLVLLNGFQKQSTYTTVAEYAKANNVSRPALCKWSVRYGIPLGRHYALTYQRIPHALRIQKKIPHDDPLLEALRKQYRISQ